MVHISSLFHLPPSQNSKQSSRRSSRDSSVASASTDNAFDEGKNWLVKQLQLHHHRQQPNAKPNHQQKHKQDKSNSKNSSEEHLTIPTTDTIHASQTILSTTSTRNTVHTTNTTRLNTASLREYGECYKRLGKGSTAIISVCRNKNVFCKEDPSKKTTKLYAVKQFRKRSKNESEKEYMKKLTSEFCISSTFHHPNIVETIDLVLDDQNRYCTVMEYCPGGDLFSVIMSEHMTDLEMFCCFKQMVQGLAYLHSVGVAHRDIKPENLLLTLDGRLKITDFGVSDVFRCAWEKKGKPSHGLVGSEPYIAPEAFEDGHEYWGSNADIWSTGIVVYSMWRGGHAWIRADKKSDREFCAYLGHYPTQTFPNFKKLDSELQKLLYKMLDPNPDTRMTAQQILDSEWMKSKLVCEKGIDAMNREHHHISVAGLKKQLTC